MLNSQAQKTLYGLMDMIYPVGSYYITESSDLDTATKMNTKFGGTWVQLDAGRFLESVTSGAGSNKNAGLPNITGGVEVRIPWTGANENGALKLTSFNTNFVDGRSNQGVGDRIYFDASKSNPIYGKSTTVQPKSRTVYIYRRTALAGEA